MMFSEVSRRSWGITRTSGLIASIVAWAERHLRCPDIRRGVQHLPLQIADVHRVAVHHADRADAGGGEIQPDRRAQSAGPDEQHARVEQLALPLPAHFGQEDVAAIALDLRFGELRHQSHS